MARRYAKPTPQAKKYTIAGAKTNMPRQAKQLAGARRFVYERQPPQCVVCFEPRASNAFPICNHCTGTS